VFRVYPEGLCVGGLFSFDFPSQFGFYLPRALCLLLPRRSFPLIFAGLPSFCGRAERQALKHTYVGIKTRQVLKHTYLDQVLCTILY
jgi:hypothetical protein